MTATFLSLGNYITQDVAFVNSVKRFCSLEKCILHQDYFKYLHKSNAIVFTILFTIKRARVHIYSTTFAEVCLFDYVICSSLDVHCWHSASAEEEKT